MSDELGAAMEDQEVEQEGATKYYTDVEDQGNSAPEQCTGDALRAIKNGNVVEEKEKAVVQGVATGILGAVVDGSVVGLQEEDNVVVKDQGEDGISVQDQHEVVEQCMSDELGVAMGDSRVHDQEVVVVVEQEGVTKHFDVAVEDQSNNTAEERCTCDELRVVRDGNDVEEKEKAMLQEVSIGILGAANDGVAVGSLEEMDVVVEGEREDGISVQDQHERCMSVELRVAMSDSVVHDQELVVVVQEGVAGCFDAAREDQSNNAAMEQCTSDEFKEVEDGNVVEEMENVVEQEGAIGILDAARDGVAIEEEDVVVEGQGEDVISAQDQHKVAERCTNDELGGTMGGSTIQDHDLAVVLDQEKVAKYFDTVVGYQSNNAVVEQCTSDESKEVKDDNFAKEKEMVVQQEGATGILGAAEEGIAFESQEEGVDVEGQGGNGFLQCQYKIVEQCTSDKLEVAMGDCTMQDQEVVVLEQEWIIGYFDAVVED